jgi:hypothetical protein
MNGKLLFAIMYSDSEDLDSVLITLKREFGEILMQGMEYDFNFTTYYENEFGKDLKKRLIIFDKNISKKDLVKVRIRTGEIEEEFSESEKRKVNIDPGYISKTELVLGTMKQRSFKEDLGQGVYAHKVVSFLDQEIEFFRHTFADYKIMENVDLFKRFITGK